MEDGRNRGQRTEGTEKKKELMGKKGRLRRGKDVRIE
jgi:hypothetical protein